VVTGVALGATVGGAVGACYGTYEAFAYGMSGSPSPQNDAIPFGGDARRTIDISFHLTLTFLLYIAPSARVCRRFDPIQPAHHSCSRHAHTLLTDVTFPPSLSAVPRVTPSRPAFASHRIETKYNQSDPWHAQGATHWTDHGGQRSAVWVVPRRRLTAAVWPQPVGCGVVWCGVVPEPRGKEG